MKRGILLLLGIVFVLASLGFLIEDVSAQTARFVNHDNYQADFNRLYRGQASTYWPQLDDVNSCVAREDIILQVSPAGCQPGVVRSDLLEEQNVPVFCQIDALKINPLVDISRIRNIRFRGDYPEEVVSVGFHPAKAALRSQDQLLGTPFMNNIGYVVVLLRKNPDENTMPDFVEFTLYGEVDYDSNDGFGVGNAEFLLETQTDQQWESSKFRQSFWQGRYFVRLDEADANSAQISIYDGDRKITTQRVDRGRTSNEIYVPGLYCQAGFQVAYDGLQSGVENFAKIRVDDDILHVAEGSRFFDNKCRVNRIEPAGEESGSVDIRCAGESIELSLGSREIRVDGEVVLVDKNGKKVDNTLWKVVKVEDGKYDLVQVGNSAETREDVDFDEIRPDTKEVLHELSLEKSVEENFGNALELYEQVADEYPNERDISSEELEVDEFYGEESLKRAIDMAERYGKQFTEARLIEKLIEIYPETDRLGDQSRRLNDLYRRDTTLAGERVEIDSGSVNIGLLGIESPDEGPIAEFSWGRDNFELELGNISKRSRGEVTLSRILGPDSVRVSVDCDDPELREKTHTITIEEGLSEEDACGLTLNLRKVEEQSVAKIRLLPRTKGTTTLTNFTVGIGIEKRAIELNPEKASEKIDDLQSQIDRWQSVSESLNSINKGLKSACFATAGVLTAKNFLTGLGGGEGFARQKVMKGYWNNQCKLLVDRGDYGSLDACYLGEADKINADVADLQRNFESVDSVTENIEESHKTSSQALGGLFGESHINTAGAANQLLDEQLESSSKTYSSHDISDFDLTDSQGDSVDSVGDLLNGADYNKGDLTYDQSRDLMLNINVLNDPNSSPRLKEIAKANLKSTTTLINDNKILRSEFESSQDDVTTGLPGMTTFLSAEGQGKIIAPVIGVGSLNDDVNINFGNGVDHVARIGVIGASRESLSGETQSLKGGEYILGLTKADETRYNINEVFRKEGSSYEKVDLDVFRTVYDVSYVQSFDSVSYNNPYLDPRVKYYETEPYKGMPAIVPFDLQAGWYAATEQTLPVFGSSMGSFDASGRPVSFWICNVGEDGREQFFDNRAGDICQLVNVNTGQPIDQFPGLTEQQAKSLVDKATRALQAAARQYGESGTIRIAGESIRVGEPTANIPSVQCQEFMSPQECSLIFNVCDPVICPSSRCDFGGEFPVADVVQTGVVGSALLCLPNSYAFGGDVAIPVCLTGIEAGIDGYLSILQSHQQCLAENLQTGQRVGICDAITSVYTCEFFWKQAVPLADVLAPKLFEIATGKGTRGGGEYLSVQNAWENAQGSVDFFTQEYAANSLEAFRVRSTQEAGTQVCRAFISAKAPTDFDSLVESDSPPQYHAWFSSDTHSSTTVPATARYKVFFHIFAGNDQGARYSVYLKNPPESSFYSVSPTVDVAAGFIPRAGFATDTVDFTAPEGYGELCVRVNNNEECGFKQVSTSFLVDSLSNQFAADELTRTGIDSQQECISGGTNPAALLNPNIQEAAEEAINPEVYNRGIVRICASRNPGSATDPQRFVDVGHCGDESLRCWLDQESVDSALTSNLNAQTGLKNSTFAELAEIQGEQLLNQQEIFPEDQINTAFVDLERELDSGDISEESVNVYLDIIDIAIEKTILNYQKAKLLYLKARAYEVLTDSLRGFDREINNANPDESSDDEETSSDGNNLNEGGEDNQESVGGLEDQEGVSEEGPDTGGGLDGQQSQENNQDLTFSLEIDNDNNLRIYSQGVDDVVPQDTGLYVVVDTGRNLRDILLLGGFGNTRAVGRIDFEEEGIYRIRITDNSASSFVDEVKLEDLDGARVLVEGQDYSIVF